MKKQGIMSTHGSFRLSVGYLHHLAKKYASISFYQDVNQYLCLAILRMKDKEHLSVDKEIQM